jgi:aminoglycoside phosphotransferase (APT) family kinase protein
MADSKADNTFEQALNKFASQSKLLRTWKLKGGVSAQVTALEIEQPDGCTQKMIVRQHGEVDLKHNPHIAVDEFELLQLLHSVGLAVPKPYYLDQSGEIFSTPYVVIEYIEGEPIFGPNDVAEDLSHIKGYEVTPAMGDASVPTHHPNSPRPYATMHPSHRFEVEPVTGLISQIATQLSRIHQVDCSYLDVSFLPQQEKIVAKRLRERPANVGESGDEKRIRDALESVWPIHQRNPSVLLHGDFWPGNILWRDGQLVAIIDWEDAALGDPLADVANSRREILWAFGIDAMQHFTHQYQSMTTIDFTNLPYWDLCASLRSAFQIAEWDLDDTTKKSMREGHRWFITQAFEKLAVQ